MYTNILQKHILNYVYIVNQLCYSYINGVNVLQTYRCEIYNLNSRNFKDSSTIKAI